MRAAERQKTVWRLRTRAVDLGVRTLVMGVVNITPDSFSDGGRFLEPAAAIEHGLRLLSEGADILDLGAESTRPGSLAGSEAAVCADEEQARLLPVLEGLLKAAPNAIVSVDTYKAATARVALKAGAEIINDVSGLTWDRELAHVCGELGTGVVLTHTRGRPDEWRGQAQLGGDALIAMVRKGLAESMAQAVGPGVAAEAIVLDPGYGFGKKFGENFSLLAQQADLLSLGRPLLAGLSRKSFLSHVLADLYEGAEVTMDSRDRASLTAMAAAILNGASIVRVHEVRAAVETARIADEIRAAMRD